ncbi:hypothetical protein Oweho_3269 [Owenweeksia hongkongensis DSM 17368]|uniref:Uncharacterized protein n=1 Tax=Owenweeksia hongkongensis (strain DSM 17368 / CIP 108786 / JCM 12287 / NRRL B-23963 / UST20020801) TaxID=926562 RepID=G8R4C0_OWEHD|nr:hypothetical protein [Owenweeksia hongkongensis]AEV34220.1 hypothetical protein Oweho_3269 [Owenweeksia hongkongensis DSM 17368]
MARWQSTRQYRLRPGFFGYLHFQFHEVDISRFKPLIAVAENLDNPLSIPVDAVATADFGGVGYYCISISSLKSSPLREFAVAMLMQEPLKWFQQQR